MSPTIGCDRGGSDNTSTVPPEPIDGLRKFDSYGDLLTTVVNAMRSGDMGTARASIATEGQVATMCPGYVVPSGGPYDAGPLDVAIAHCQEVFANIPDEAVASSLETDTNGVDAPLQPDTTFDYWREQCPNMEAFMLTGVFEVRGEGLPQAAVEVNGIFTHDGKWILVDVPRCRGEGE